MNKTPAHNIHLLIKQKTKNPALTFSKDWKQKLKLNTTFIVKFLMLSYHRKNMFTVIAQLHTTKREKGN